jgi:hypothetical protein
MEGMCEGECPWGVDTYLDGSLMLVLDACYGAGDFFFAKVLMQLISSGKSHVVLLSANHGPEHWEYLLKKHSLELRRRGLLDRLCIKYLVPDFNNNVSDAEARKVKESCYTSEHYTWLQLCSWIDQDMPFPSAGSTADKVNINLFVDDLDAFEAFCPISANADGTSCTQSQNARFIMNDLLYSLRNTKTLNSITVLGATDTTTGSDAAALSSVENSNSDEVYGSTLTGCASYGPTLTEYCKTTANITIALSPLTSGYSQDVHGVVHITAMPVNAPLSKLTSSIISKTSLIENSYTFKTIAPNTILSHNLVGGRFK